MDHLSWTNDNSLATDTDSPQYDGSQTFETNLGEPCVDLPIIELIILFNHSLFSDKH